MEISTRLSSKAKKDEVQRVAGHDRWQWDRFYVLHHLNPPKQLQLINLLS